MKSTNEIKFSSYGVWDLLRKVYQNKEELLPKLGFNTYEEFLDWMKTGDQDTQDEFQNIITKHETEKQTTMTEGKLKQTIKEEIKRILSKDIEEGYQIPSIAPSSMAKGDGRRFIPTTLPFPSSIRKRFGDHIVYNPGNDTLFISAILYNNLIKGYTNQIAIKKLIMDIPPMLKQVLNKTEHYGPTTELPKEFQVYHPFTQPVKKAMEDKYTKAGKKFYSAGDLLVPNLNVMKNLEEGADHNKNSMIRGMMNMLKNPEIKNASFKELMDLNIAMQQLMPDIQRPDYGSPSNTAAIQAMINMDKEKGRRPSLDENEDKTDEVVDDLKDEMSSVLKALDNELKKKSKTQNEGLLTVAGIALALPAIMGLVAKFGKAAGNTVRKVLGKKPTDKGEYNEWMAKLGGIADDLHHLYMAPIKGIVSKFIKDKTKADKVSSAIFHVIIATFLVISGATAVKALQAKNISLTTLEAALTAVKGGEVQNFITKLVA